MIGIKGFAEKGKKRKDGSSPSFIINPEQLEIVAQGLKESIGKPINYKDYCKNGKKNDEGSRQIPIMADDTEDEYDFIRSHAVQPKVQEPTKKI